MTEDGTWPEQEIISAWLKRRGISIPFDVQYELQEELTKLRAISQESVRLEARLEAAEIEAARIALHAAIAMNEGFSDKWYEERWRYVDALCKAALQSPARAAEGEPVREALSNLVSLLLQTMEPIGPMRDRKDYPPELQTAINVLRASPAREDVYSTELRK